MSGIVGQNYSSKLKYHHTPDTSSLLCTSPQPVHITVQLFAIFHMCVGLGYQWKREDGRLFAIKPERPLTSVPRHSRMGMPA